MRNGLVLAVIALAGIVVFGLWKTGAATLFDRELPEPPSGPHRVAWQDLILPLPLAGQPTLPASFWIRIWYPDDLDKGAPSAAVTKSHSVRPGVTEGQRWPLVIFVPAWGGLRMECSIAATNLASRGFVVAGVDDVMHDPPPEQTTPESEAARTSSGDFTSVPSQLLSMKQAELRVQQAARKISAVIDALDQGGGEVAGKPLATRLDFDKIGVLGDSLGGAAAAESALADRRIRAVVNMDGWLFGSAARTTLSVPYLVFNSGLPNFQRRDLDAADLVRRFTARMTFEDRAHQARQAAHPDTLRLLVEGSVHPDFSDAAFASTRWHNWRPWRGALTAPRRMQLIVESYVGAFFERYLAGQTAPLIAQRPSPFPEVRILGTTP